MIVILSGLEPETPEPKSGVMHFTTGQYKNKKPVNFEIDGFEIIFNF
jgi:hypothetical protein